MKLLFSILLLFSGIYYLNAQSQNEHENLISIKGTIICKADSNKIPYAHIIQLKRNKGNVSSRNGFFRLNAIENDTITITAIGYKTMKITVSGLLKMPGELKIIMLEPEVYDMEEVIIVPYKNYKELKEAILAYDPPDEPEIDLGLPKLTKNQPNEDGLVPIVSFSPVTALYNKFSREGKERAEYHRLIKQKEIENKVEKKYNIEIIKHITGLQDERKIYDFMDFCKFSPEFILSANDYQIYLAINNCYESFLGSLEE